MRVLFTTAWYPNRKVAGDGVFIQKHAQAVARLNDVAVLMVQTDVNAKGIEIETETAPSSCLVYVPKIRFEIPVITGLLRLMWLMLGYLKGYRYIKKTWWGGQRPDICHVNVLTRAAGLPWLLYKIHHIPYIITEHWSRYARPASYPDSRMQLWLGRMFVRDAAYVCPVSLNLEQSMKKWGLVNKNYCRVGNVVECSNYTIAPLSAFPRFVHVSWMRDDSKNISGILRVLARLKETGYKYHMDFIGEGNDKDKLVAYATSLGVNVSFKGALQGPDLFSELCRHDAMVMFSNYENQPVSILEALSCGLPVIATKVGAIPGMLAQKRGITIDPGNEEQLYEVLKDFISLYQNMTEEQRKDRTMAKARHQYVVEHHSPEVIARQFDALYHSALSRK